MKKTLGKRHIPEYAATNLTGLEMRIQCNYDVPTDKALSSKFEAAVLTEA
jgi:hypothetical protein